MTAAVSAEEPRVQARFMHGPVLDLAVAFCWVPFAAVTVVLARSGTDVTPFVAGVMLLSFAHQPLTIALVYGDGEQFRLRRTIFTWSPLVFVVLVIVGYEIGYITLAVVGGLWNAEHTLMQRYGMTRIYGRMVGQDDGRIEKLVLFSWLLLALVWVAADARTPARVQEVDLGKNNSDAIEALVTLRPVALVVLVPLALAAAGLAVAWFVREVRRPRWNPVKWAYLGSTAALFAVILVDPLAGVMGYVGAHALEYFVIVHQSLGRRYADPALDGGAPLGRVVRAPTGRLGFFAIYIAVIFGLVTLLGRMGSPLAYSVVFFTLGGLHVFYDGFIWKLRRPAVARSLAIPSTDPREPGGVSLSSNRA